LKITAKPILHEFPEKCKELAGEQINNPDIIASTPTEDRTLTATPSAHPVLNGI
jgi:hypothetical protein